MAFGQSANGMAYGTHADDKNPFTGRVNPRKVQTNWLREQVQKLRDPNSFGMSESEKQAQVADAQQQAGMQRQGAQAELGRQALAGQGFQQGAFVEASQKIADGAAQDAAAASADVQDRNQQLIQMGVDRALGAVAAERAGRKASQQWWAQFGLEGYKAVGENVGKALAGLA